MQKNVLVIGTILLFIFLAMSPPVLSYSIRISDEKEKISSSYLDDGPMDSPWPMYCHDAKHTGRSPYSTADNPGIEKWRFDTDDCEVTGSPVIDSNGIIYIGASDFFAIYPNGTQKWKFEIDGIFESAPAIDENGVLYIGTIWAMPNYLYAIYTSNGTFKWKYSVGDLIASSPAIGADGSIYFGSEDDYIYALYPNGTLKWKYLTSVAVYSSPAIGDDGTIYCGSHDTYLYALYPDNGTLKWKYKTGNWIRTAPCIADDGTIYVVSLDNCLHAVNPDGTQKWITYMGEGGTSPTIGQDGTIYAGYRALRAINPINGSVKWTFDPGPNRYIRGGTPCNSVDGIIYFGTYIGEYDGGELIAVNPNGTERWRIMLATDWIMSAPAIGSDGTVYIGSFNDGYHPGSWGYLHAIGKGSPNAPNKPSIDGPRKGKINTNYTYTAVTTDADGDNVSYYFDWGDGTNSGWTSYVPSGTSVSLAHSWQKNGFYIIKVKAKDDYSKESDWGKLIVKMPKDKTIYNTLFLKILDHFPLLERLLYIFN